MSTRSAHDLATVVGSIDPQALQGTTISSDWVDLSKWSLALFVLSVGTIDAVIDFKIVEAKDTIGTGSQDLTGKAVTQLAATADNTQAAISVCDDNLTENSGYRYCRAVVTVASGTSNVISVVAIGLNPKQLPASDYKHADLLQLIN
jgi:hypothetical protein